MQTVNGVATVTLNIALYGTGDSTFSAQYFGSKSFQPSVSNSVTVTV